MEHSLAGHPVAARLGVAGAGRRQRVLRRGRVLDRHGPQDAHRSADRRRSPRRARGAARRRPSRIATSPPRSSASRWPASGSDGSASRRSRRSSSRRSISCRRRWRTRPRTASSVAIAFAFITALHIVFGELAPKTIALERAEATALLVVKPPELFMRVFWPFIRVLNGIGTGGRQAARPARRRRHAMVHSEEELKMLVTASQEAGVLEEQEEQMLHRVFGFADLTAGQVMVPRTEIVGDRGRRAARTRWSSMLSRGRLHAASRLPEQSRQRRRHPARHRPAEGARCRSSGRSTPARLAREALTVPETLGADDLLAEMRRRGVREAHRHRRVRRHGRARHLRVADGAHRRRPSAANVGDCASASDSGRMDRPTSTGSRSSPT